MFKQSEHPPAGERIAKVIARAGLASRREAEAWIAAGRVAVNGKLVTSPALNVGARDRIEVDGQPLPMRERTRLFLYHKQRGLLTTHADPGGRPTIFSVLPKELTRLISVAVSTSTPRVFYCSQTTVVLPVRSNCRRPDGCGVIACAPMAAWRRRSWMRCDAASPSTACGMVRSKPPSIARRAATSGLPSQSGKART